MKSDEKSDPISLPTLQLFSNTNTLALMQSPERSGTLTPPLYTSAAVPFRWEEEPGKPRGSASFNAVSAPRCLELPPRLLDPNAGKLNSPTTVLEGPYFFNGRQRFQSSSFRIERREVRDLDRSFLGSRRWGKEGLKGKREVVGESCVFPNFSIDINVENKEVEEEDGEMSCSESVKMMKIQRPRSFSRSRLWVTIYGSLKQVFPWRNRKLNKDGIVI